MIHPDFRVLLRFEQLKAMHALAMLANDEYIIAEWLEEVPDEPSDDDLKFIVKDDQAFKSVCDAFARITKKKNFYY